MRVRSRAAVLVLSLAGAAAADTVSVTPASCSRRSALDPADYQRLWRFLALGGGYREWTEKDCYPPRLDDAALAASPQPAGHVISVAGKDVFVVRFDPTWFSRCKKLPTAVSGSIAVTGAKLLALAEHIASLPELASVDLRELGLAEALLRDRSAIFALHLGTQDRSVHLECFEDLDRALERAGRELGAPARTPR